jgi:hypothetical protein
MCGSLPSSIFAAALRVEDQAAASLRAMGEVEALGDEDQLAAVVMT